MDLWESSAAQLKQLARDRYELVWMVPATKEPAAEVAGAYDLQDAFFLPLSGFSAVERPGPTVRIYRLRKR